MKKLLLSSVALFGLSAAALAADLPRRQYVAPAPVPVVPVPVFTWTGFYIGGNAGYGFSDNNNDLFDNGFVGGGFGSGLSVQTNAGLQPVVPLTGINNLGLGFDNRRNRDGFVGGGQIGYNFQFTPGSGWVIGIEADAQYADFDRRRNDDFGGFGLGGGTGIFTAATVAPIAPGSGIAPPTGVGNGALGNVALFNGFSGNGFNSFDRNRIEWFGTVRGRLGYAFDRLLIYATGGGAFTDRRDRRNDGFGFFGTGVGSGAALVGTGFFTTGAAATVGGLVAPTNTGFFNDNRSNDNWGWTVGGGVEYAFTSGFFGLNNVSVKIEGLYVNFERDRKNNGFVGGGNVVGVSNTGAAVLDSQFAGVGFDNRRNRDDFAVVRAGLNWKFGSFFGL
jgi:outer membrane immunogenic protein